VVRRSASLALALLPYAVNDALTSEPRVTKVRDNFRRVTFAEH
jgi:hypothetical protein